ncbi:MAG TPA: alpha/beta fold hydrolase [Luteimonas sp.]|nr:alpha/beta fold hydrolase [Luteimonas sp.]
MDIELGRLDIEVARGESVEATLLAPQRALPGVLFVHGWGGSQSQDLSRAREVAALGCVCLTFDLRGHRADAASRETVTRAQNLDDLCACYDWLAAQQDVDADAVAVVGVSYGGYLAAILSQLRPLRWLALRTPALYLDRDWDRPKRRLHDDPELVRFRNSPVPPEDNRALRACRYFKGDALLVEAGRDRIIPHQVIENYAGAFAHARSMTRRLVQEADHGFDDKTAQRQYSDILLGWMTEMIMGSRGAIAASRVRDYRQAQRDGDERASATSP